MGTRTSTTQHLFRQRSSLALAVVCGVTGLLLLVTMAWQWADNPQPLFAAWMFLGLAVVWSLFVRPAVLLDDDGVTIRNILRDIHIPWALLTDVEFRWNLKVFVGDRVYAAWAISSQDGRPKSANSGMFGAGIPARLDRFANANATRFQPSQTSTAPTQSSKVTASSVARVIEQAMQEYAEAVAQGALPAAPDAKVRATWVPLVIAVLVLPAIAVAVLSLT